MTRLAAFLPKTALSKQGHTFADASASLRENLNHYLRRLGSLTQVQFGVPSRPGGWSPAEITDHLQRSNQLYEKALERSCAGQDPLELPRGLLTDDGRMLAVAALPAVGGRGRLELCKALALSVEDLLAAAEQAARLEKLDEIALVGGFFGPLTGLECVQLASAHLRHHANQLPEGKQD